MIRQTPLTSPIDPVPAWRVSEQGPGAVDRFLERLHEWKAQKPNRKLGRAVKQIVEERRLDKQRSGWVDVATETQINALRAALNDGADPNLMVAIRGQTHSALSWLAPCSARAARLLIEAKAPWGQELLDLVSEQALLWIHDRDEHGYEFYQAMREDKDQDAFGVNRVVHTPFPWLDFIPTLTQTPGLDWYSPLRTTLTTEMPKMDYVKRFSPVAALGYKQAIRIEGNQHGSVRCMLESEQAARGEPVGRPLPGTLSDEERDQMFLDTHFFDYSTGGHGDVLDGDECKARRLALLEMGADPNMPVPETRFPTWLLSLNDGAGSNRTPLTVMEWATMRTDGESGDTIDYFNTLLSHGGRLTDRVVAMTANNVLRNLEIEEKDCENPFDGETSQQYQSRVRSARKTRSIRQKHLRRLFLVAETQDIDFERLDGGNLAKRLEQAWPGFSVGIDLVRMEKNTAKAAPTRGRKPGRL